jgi:hypothetical protein
MSQNSDRAYKYLSLKKGRAGATGYGVVYERVAIIRQQVPY